MLTPTDKKNIHQFKTLKPNHQRVFKHRLRKKCISSIRDIRYVLLNYDKMKLRLDKFVQLEDLISLIKTYEEVYLLQNM